MTGGKITRVRAGTQAPQPGARFLDGATPGTDIRRGAQRPTTPNLTEDMKYELLTDLAPEEVIRQAEEFFREHTRMAVDERNTDRLELSGAIGVAKIVADRDHGGHTTVYAETDRGAGFDVTDVTLRFLYSLPHV